MFHSILEHKPNEARSAETQYLVQWQGGQKTWESERHFFDKTPIEQYFARIGKPAQSVIAPRQRVLLIGDAEVGKSSLIRRLDNRPFTSCYQRTGFYAMYDLSSVVPNVDIIEVPGSEYSRCLAPQAFQTVDRIVLMLSLDDAHTLYSYHGWMQKFQHLQKPVFILVNKTDLDDEPRSVIYSMLSLHSVHKPWRYISAKTDSQETLIKAVFG